MDVTSPGVMDEQHYANCLLIAAAPDLLAALEELMGASLDDDEGIEAAKRLGSALQAARAAINKAEGR